MNCRCGASHTNRHTHKRTQGEKSHTWSAICGPQSERSIDRAGREWSSGPGGVCVRGRERESASVRMSLDCALVRRASSSPSSPCAPSSPCPSDWPTLSAASSQRIQIARYVYIRRHGAVLPLPLWGLRSSLSFLCLASASSSRSGSSASFCRCRCRCRRRRRLTTAADHTRAAALEGCAGRRRT